MSIPTSAETISFKFRSDQRILSSKDFAAIGKYARDKGTRSYATHVLILYRPSNLTKSRLGITVTKKIAQRANKRNLIKRRLREIFRRSQHLLKNVYDIVFIARQEAEKCSYKELEFEVLDALKRKGIIYTSGQ